MKTPKKNSTLWYSLGLVLLLCITVPVLATGTAFARYKSDAETETVFAVKEKPVIYTGTVREDSDGEKSFEQTDELVWENDGETATLTLAVANGPEEGKSWYKSDQRIRIRIFASLGLWAEKETAEVKIVLPAEEGSEEGRTVQAAAERIKSGTYLHRIYGEGWILTFPDKNGEEIFWDIDGERFSYVTITVTAESSAMDGTALLIPEIKAEVIK